MEDVDYRTVFISIIAIVIDIDILIIIHVTTLIISKLIM
jgi:hypothetical protein